MIGHCKYTKVTSEYFEKAVIDPEVGNLTSNWVQNSSREDVGNMVGSVCILELGKLVFH